MKQSTTALACGFILAAATSFAAGPDKNRREKLDATSDAEPAIAAKVGKEAVYVAEVDDLLASRRRKSTTDDSPELRAAALEQLINQRLVAQYLAREGYAVAKGESDELVDELKRKLSGQNLTFDEFRHRHQLTEHMVRRRLEWDVMWSEFLANEATDEVLEKFFDAHRRDYDGSELRVSHILFAVKPEDGDEKLRAATEQAKKVRSQIVSGELSFAKAAEKYSSGPSRRHSGDLGFIPRRDRMTEAFSGATFALKQGEISEAVLDQFGVHLIQWTDAKPGEREWRDARRELFEAFARQRFNDLAAAERKRVEVKLTASDR